MRRSNSWSPRLLAKMVYYKKSHGKCHVCQRCSPRTWFRCRLCGVWMGSGCNPRQVPYATGNLLLDDSRYEQFDVSLHCYIWTSEVKNVDLRADLCCNCVSNKVLKRVDPVHVKRKILQFMSWASWWWGSFMMFYRVWSCRAELSWGRGFSPTEAIAT